MVVQYIVGQISETMGIFYREFGVKIMLDLAPFSI
jgi:hypothetical protein